MYVHRDHARGTGKRAGSFGDRDDEKNNVDSSAVGMFFTHVFSTAFMCLRMHIESRFHNTAL
jgi:hypothetical protein